MNKKSKMEATINISEKGFFYKQVLEFHRPSKFLCQTYGLQNHWSLLYNVHTVHIKYLQNSHLQIPKSGSAPKKIRTHEHWLVCAFQTSYRIRECSRCWFNLFSSPYRFSFPIFFYLKLKEKGPYSFSMCPPSKYSMHRIQSIQ